MIENIKEIIKFYNSLKKPILILSSRAGRGNISIGEAIFEYFENKIDVYHRTIEDFIDKKIVNEDLVRYKIISTYFPFLLFFIYKVPFFYSRKLIREKYRKTKIDLLKDFIISKNIKTVICISHRQAFWTSVLKRNENLKIEIYGVLTEFGMNIGWKYIFWKEINGFISSVNRDFFKKMSFPPNIIFKEFSLTARSKFYSISPINSKRECLVIGGFLGQGKIYSTVKCLVKNFPEVKIYVVCGENKKLELKLKKKFKNSNISIYGIVDSIEELLKINGCVITKPGMGTLLEASAARRKIFLFKGMPVAEKNNARYAIENFGAEWFSIASFRKWLRNK